MECPSSPFSPSLVCSPQKGPMRCIARRALCRAPHTRGLFMFTEQDKVLTAVSSVNKFKSPVWVEKDDLRVLKTDIKPGSQATVVTAFKRLELFNIDQVANPPAEFGLHTTAHTSANSGKPYGTKMVVELEQKRLQRGFHSFWWIGRGELKKRNLSLRSDNERPSVVLFNSKIEVFNGDQLQNPDAARYQPISAASKKPYMGEVALQLMHHMRSNGYTTGLYLTEAQVNKFRVELRPGEIGIPLASGASNDTLFNVEDFDRPEDLCNAFGRVDAQVPSYLSSGKPMKESRIAQCTEYNTRNSFAKNLWITRSEAEAKGFKLRPDRVGVQFPRLEAPLLLFNADQTNNRAEVIRQAGTVV